jgi:hypothetical protein
VDAEDDGLELHPHEILYAFELAGPYATGKSNTAKLQNRKELALGLVDWAVMESDRGMKLLELTNRVDDLEAQLSEARKGGGGTIVIGPFGLG